MIFLYLILSFLTPSLPLTAGDNYAIQETYSRITPDYGTKVLTSYGNLEEAEEILVPTKLDIGTYKVNVTRKAANLYHVVGTDIYIETRYCYKYGYSVEAVLDITSSYGYTRGEIIFL